MATLPAYTLPLIVLSCSIAAFFAGMLFEKLRWNALIDEGKLPRPRHRKPRDLFLVRPR